MSRWLIIVLILVPGVLYSSEFDRCFRKYSLQNPVNVDFTNHQNKFVSRDEVLKELALTYYQVETAQFKTVLLKLHRLKARTETLDGVVKGTYYLTLARLNYRIGKLQKAFELNGKAIRLLKQAKELETLSLAYCNQAFFYTFSDQPRARAFLSHSEQLERKGVHTYEVLRLSNATFLYLLKPDLQRASAYCHKAQEIESKAEWHNPIDQYRIYILRASLSELKGDIQQENSALRQAKKLAVKYHILDNWKQVANAQSVNALEKGNISEAYYLLREKDSLSNLIPNNEIAEFLQQMQLDEQMELEIAEKKLIQNELENKHFQVLIVLLFSGLLSITLLILIIQRYWIKHGKRLLMKQHLDAVNKEHSTSNQPGIYSGLIEQIEVLVKDKELFQHTNLTLDRLAKKLGTNRSYLSECINNYYRVNYPQWIAGLRIEAAKRYLLDKKYDLYSIEGISKTVGFSSISTFNATFKRETGLTPSQFRKLGRNYL